MPNLFSLSTLVASSCVLQFKYTLQPLLYLGYTSTLGAVVPDEGFNLATGTVTRHGNGSRRWFGASSSIVAG
jgi:hypothetical protein